jgi:hypothetical protein
VSDKVTFMFLNLHTVYGMFIGSGSLSCDLSGSGDKSNSRQNRWSLQGMLITVL